MRMLIEVVQAELRSLKWIRMLRSSLLAAHVYCISSVNSSILGRNTSLVLGLDSLLSSELL